MRCESCRTGIDHCHGTVVRHLDGAVECTEAGCAEADLARHVLVIECESIDGGCGCAAEPSAPGELQRAS